MHQLVTRSLRKCSSQQRSTPHTHLPVPQHTCGLGSCSPGLMAVEKGVSSRAGWEEVTRRSRGAPFRLPPLPTGFS